MAQFVRERLALDNRGWTRAELASLIRRDPRFSRRFERNPKVLGDMIRRLDGRGEIEERDGRLFAAESMRLDALARFERFELVRDFRARTTSEREE